MFRSGPQIQWFLFYTTVSFLGSTSVVDEEKRIMALIGFDTHENYNFRQTPLNKDDCKKILSAPNNIKTFTHAVEKIAEAKTKVERTEQNYRNCHCIEPRI